LKIPWDDMGLSRETAFLPQLFRIAISGHHQRRTGPKGAIRKGGPEEKKEVGDVD